MKRSATLLCIYLVAASPAAAAIPLKQSTSSQEVPIGVMLDEDDGKTAKTALSIANTDIKIWKAGATSLANKNSGGATHISGGVYYAVLDGTDTDTLGPLVLFVHKAGALPKRVNCVVHPANVYDSLVGSENLDVNVSKVGGHEWGGDDAPLNLISFFDNGGIATSKEVDDLGKVTHINNVAASSVTTIGANLGTTQPINFTGSGASANVKSTNPFFVASGTATDGGTSDLEWLSGSSTNDFYNGMMIVISDASTNNRPHVATVTDWDGSAGVLTFSPALSVSVANGDTFQLLYVPREIKGTYDSLTAGVTLADNAITAAKVEQGAIDEIQNGLSSFDPNNDEVIVGTNNDKSDYGLSTTSIAGIWNAATSDLSTSGSIGKRIVDNLNAVVGDLPPQSYFEALFDGAPTFGDAMDEHGYTTALAHKLDRSAATLLVSTAIAGSPTSNTQFALADGPDEDDALRGALVIVTRDGITPKKAVGLVKRYDGSSKAVELVTDPEIFAFAEDDEVDVIATGSPAALWLGGAP